MIRLILILASVTHVMAQEFKPLESKPTNAKAVPQPAGKAIALPAVSGKPSLPTAASGTPASSKDSSLVPLPTTTGSPAILGGAPTTTATNGIAPSDVAGRSPYGYIPPPVSYVPPAPVVIQQAAPISPLSGPGNFGGGGGGNSPAYTPQNNYAPRSAQPYYEDRTTPAYQGPNTATPGISPSDTSTNPSANFTRSLDMPSAGSCGKGQDMWSAVKNLSADGPLKPNGGYDMQSTGWPSLNSNNGKLSVSFSPGTKSMCTSATATAFEQHIADLTASGDLSLNAQEIAFLNGPVTHNAFNGNTYSVAYFYDQLGGKSMIGKGSTIASVLAQAKPGDVMKLDRKDGTGHSTIFKDVENGKVCYWTSNTPTNGAAVNCESIDKFVDVAVSRFPSDTKDLPKRIDAMMNDKNLSQKFSTSKADIKASDVHVASSLDCGVSSQRGVAGSPAQPGPSTGAK